MTTDSTQTDLVFGVGEFVAYINQTLEAAYPYIAIEGEVSSFRVSRGKWVYFDLKDETATVRCFTTVYSLSGPLEDGMMVRVQGSPRLHPQYNFSFNVQAVRAVGEGSLKRQAEMIQAKLAAEGLFDEARKRRIPYIPKKIALISAISSAAYADFTKIISARWGGLEITVFDTLVQGEQAPAQIVKALERVNTSSEPYEVVVMIRGGGSIEDLTAFSDEQVVRAVAASRVPTLAAIGHETDLSLVEMAADMRASTPSNAAELLVPDKQAEKRQLTETKQRLGAALSSVVAEKRADVSITKSLLKQAILHKLSVSSNQLKTMAELLVALDPRRPLKQGYALVSDGDGLIRSIASVKPGATVSVELHDGQFKATVVNKHQKGS